MRGPSRSRASGFRRPIRTPITIIEEAFEDRDQWPAEYRWHLWCGARAQIAKHSEMPKLPKLGGKRLFAIGDIHGCYAALLALDAELGFGGQDCVITLGDYVDRGPDS